MLTIFSKPNCPNCDSAKNYLTAMDIQFATKDITRDPLAHSFLVKEGHRSVPQIYNENELFCNYNELIAKTKEQINEMIGDINVSELRFQV